MKEKESRLLDELYRSLEDDRNRPNEDGRIQMSARSISLTLAAVVITADDDQRHMFRAMHKRGSAVITLYPKRGDTLDKHLIAPLLDAGVVVIWKGRASASMQRWHVYPTAVGEQLCAIADELEGM